MSEPRRVELNAAQAVRLQSLMARRNEIASRLTDAEGELQAAMADATNGQAREGDEQTLWEMKVGDESVELVEVIRERPAVLPEVQ